MLTQPSWDELPSASYCCMDRRPKPNARSIFERSEPDSGNETLASRTRENSKKGGSRRSEVESDDEDNVEDDESGFFSILLNCLHFRESMHYIH